MRIVLLAAVAAFSTPCLAQQTGDKPTSVDGPAATQSATPAAKSEDAAEKKICRRIDASESRVASQRVCLTQEQWKKRDQEASEL